MNNLISFGDSFTRGSELSDCLDTIAIDELSTDCNNLSDRDLEIFSKHNAGPFSELDFYNKYKLINSCYSRKTWSALLAKELNLNYICHAKPGCSNETIIRKLMQYIPNITSKDVIIINWTFIDRWDFVDPDKLPIESRWVSITPTSNKKTNFEKFYFKYIQSELLYKWQTLKNILFAISILQNNNIKYLMTCVDPLILDNKHHAPSYVKNIQDKIRNDIIWFEELGFDDWCTKHKFPRGKENNHPLEEAHIAAFEYIKNNYDFTK